MILEVRAPIEWSTRRSGESRACLPDIPTSALAFRMAADLPSARRRYSMAGVKMTSRERVMAALNHQEPDRVPIDLGQATGDGITLAAYRNLLRFLGMADQPIQVKDKRGQTARVDEEVLRRFRVDFRGIGPRWSGWLEGCVARRPNLSG